MMSPWTNTAFIKYFDGVLQTDTQSSPSKEETSMLKVLNTLRSEPGTPADEKKPPIADASFDTPGSFALKDNFLKAGQYVAVHAPLVRAKKGDPPIPLQPLVPQKVNTKSTPVAALAKPIDRDPTPDQDVKVEEKKRSSPEPEPATKHQKLPPTPKPKQPEIPVAVQLPPATPPSPKPTVVSPPMPTPPGPDLPPDDEEELSSDDVPAVVPPRPAAPKKTTPKSAPMSARAELLAGTGINENSYDSAEEPSDGESLGESNEDSDDEEEDEGPARPLPPVHLSYEQRQAAEIAAVQAQQQQSSKSAEKGKKKKVKLTWPKIQHINATVENSPIPPGFVEPKTKKTKAAKEDKALLSKLVNSERFFSRITPQSLKRKPQDLDSHEKGPNAEFVELWNHAVDLALDVEFKRTADRTKAKKYGAKYEARWHELAKKVVYDNRPKDERETRILALHRLFWCYHNVALLVPESPVSTSECWIVFSLPREGQSLHIAQEVRVTFHYRYYEGILFAYKGIHPWEFLKGRAAFFAKRIRQSQITVEKAEERLKNWENNGVLRLMEWVNSTIMSGWGFFT